MLHIKETSTTLIIKGSKKELYDLSRSLALRPKNYFMNPSYQTFKTTGIGWDGYIYPIKLNKEYTEGKVGRGYLERVQNAAEKLSIPLKLELLPLPFQDLCVEDIPDDLINIPFDLSQEQKECVVSWLKRGIGLHYVSVSGGKTVTFLAAAQMIKNKYPEAKFLYMTPTERLIKQVYSEAKEALPGWHITQCGGGKKKMDGKDMIIMTNAFLTRNYISITPLLKTFVCILLDEVHTTISPKLKPILKRIPAFFRFGASDTLREDDPLKCSDLTELVGPVQERVEIGPLILLGRSAKPTIYLLDKPDWKGKFDGIPATPDEGSTAWALIDGDWKKATYVSPVYERDEHGNTCYDKKSKPIIIPSYHKLIVDGIECEVNSKLCLLHRTADKAIIQFKDRNDLILQWGTHWANTLGQTLIIATKSIHVQMLLEMFEAKIGVDRVRTLTGDSSSKARDEGFQWFGDTPNSVLISSIVKVGVSLNFIRGGVVADYVASYELANQLIGRFIRKKQTDNTAHITMFLERQHKTLYKGSVSVVKKLERVRGYRYLHPVTTPDTIPNARVYEDVIIT
jgi:superfamily II DNA or RNA helicase